MTQKNKKRNGKGKPKKVNEKRAAATSASATVVDGTKDGGVAPVPTNGEHKQSVEQGEDVPATPSEPLAAATVIATPTEETKEEEKAMATPPPPEADAVAAASKESETESKTTTAAAAATVGSAQEMKLHSSWTLWFDNPKLAPQGSDWKENLKQVATFQTVGDFWKVYNNILPPSMITISSNYSIFREGIEPTWEHPENCNGGKFVLTLPKSARQQQQQQQQQPSQQAGSGEKLYVVPKLDEYWLWTVLAVLGETMDATGDQVCGAVVSLRKNQDRIALWLKSDNQEVCVRIGERWKKALDMEKTTLRYQTHRDAAATGRSFRIDVHFEV